VAQLQEGPSPIELLEVEEELDLDSPLVAGELAEAAGQGAGVEGSDGSHGTSVEDDPW
jgi:hypothetical protein